MSGFVGTYWDVIIRALERGGYEVLYSCFWDMRSFFDFTKKQGRRSTLQSAPVLA